MKTADAPKAGAKYRSDIDGLRAVAVLMVLGSHLGVSRMAGGFVGVDMFFVISGYLITGIVARDIVLDRFSLAGFYERRLRRIYPALMVVLLATMLAVYVLFPPTSLVSYSYSLLGALFSYSNLYFATQSGYFADSYTKILQHTWSLGVEEQFYLALPVCLLAFAKFSKRAMQWFVCIGWVVSLAWSCFAVLRNADTAFYMPYTRAWELLSGSALALGVVPSIPSRWVKEALALVSLLTLAFCMEHYTAGTLFPGVSALPVCVASVMLLKLGEGEKVIAMQPLRWPPMVFVGLISYSLYLWHWPILVLLHLGLWHNWTGETVAQQGCIAVACVAIATLSWRFVEQPFRTGEWKRLSRGQVFLASGLASLVLTMAALTGIADHGLPWRFSPRGVKIGSYLDQPQQMRQGVCFYEGPRQKIQRSECLTSVEGAENVLLLGDSHAAMLWYGLKHAAPAINLMQFNAAGCYPFPGRYDRSNCGRSRHFLFEEYLPTAKVDAVVLAIRWVTVNDAQTLEPLLQIFTSRHVPVFLVGPVPEYQAPLPLLLMLGDKWADPGLARSRQIQRLESLDQELADRFGSRPGVTYLSAYQALCHPEGCREYLDSSANVPLMPDTNHLTNQASLELVRGWVSGGKLFFRPSSHLK